MDANGQGYTYEELIRSPEFVADIATPQKQGEQVTLAEIAAINAGMRCDLCE